MADGTLGILDCGMVGRIDDYLRENIEEILVAVASLDGPMLARLLMRLCNAPGDFDEGTFSADITDFISFYGSQPIEHFTTGQRAQHEIARCISRYRLVLPSAMAQILKVLVMLDGTAKLLSPKVNLHRNHRSLSAPHLPPPALAAPPNQEDYTACSPSGNTSPKTFPAASCACSKEVQDWPI